MNALLKIRYVDKIVEICTVSQLLVNVYMHKLSRVVNLFWSLYTAVNNQIQMRLTRCN